MKRKICLILVVLLVVFASAALSYAADSTQTKFADALYELGLFSGTGTNKDGTPIYGLEKAPSRAEAITMLVRLLGKADEAISQEWETPFTDVPAWAQPYVGYAYNNGLTKGVSATKFGSSDKASEAQYISFVLRALGYSDDQDDPNKDFSWDTSKTLSNDLGITYGDADTNFLRGDVVEISYFALKTKLKNSKTVLLESLHKAGAVSSSEIATVERVKRSADGTKIYLPDEVCDGIKYKDLARACGCSEDIYYIVNPKTEADHINNTKYCVLTGQWSYSKSDGGNAVAKTSWGNCEKTIVGRLDVYGTFQQAQLFGAFANYWTEFYYADGQYYLDVKIDNPVMTPELVQEHLIEAYKIIEAKHKEFYSSGKLNANSSDYEIAKVYYDWLYSVSKTAKERHEANIGFPEAAKCETAYAFIGLGLSNCVGHSAAFAMAMGYEGIPAYTISCAFTPGEWIEHVVGFAFLDGKEYICEEYGTNPGLWPVQSDGSVTENSFYLSPYLIAMARKSSGLSYDKNYDITDSQCLKNLGHFTAYVTDIPFTVKYLSTNADGDDTYLVKIDSSYKGTTGKTYQAFIGGPTGNNAKSVASTYSLDKWKAGKQLRILYEDKLYYIILGMDEWLIKEN